MEASRYTSGRHLHQEPIQESISFLDGCSLGKPNRSFGKREFGLRLDVVSAFIARSSHADRTMEYNVVITGIVKRTTRTVFPRFLL